MTEEGTTATVAAHYEGWHVAAVGHVQIRFGGQHLFAAASFSRRVGELEHGHAGEGFGPFFDEILHAASASVFMAVASLEAFASELREDLKLPGAFEQGDLIDRYDQLLAALGAQSLDRGGSPVQDIAALLVLRNALVHFKPAPLQDQREHERISRRLSGRRSPFLGSGETMFPLAWASHGRTRWAVENAVAFEALVTTRLGVGSRLTKHASRLATT